MSEPNKPKKFSGTEIGSVFAKKEQMNQKKKNLAKEKGIETRQLEVALAVILVDLASCDGSFDQTEYTIIMSGLMSVFGTPKDEVSALVNQAKVQLQGMRGTSGSAALLKQYLDMEEKTAIVEIIDELIASDGIEDGFETYLRAKTIDLLGLPADFEKKKNIASAE